MLLEAALTLTLTCPGASIVYGTSQSESATASDNIGYSATVSGETNKPMHVEGTVDVKIVDGVARIQVPSILIGAASGSGGWFPVKDFVVTDTEITGRVRVGWFNSSTFNINRSTGVMTSGAGFRGQCTKVDETKRAF